MIITCLRGGIGNQLFQYAAGRALAVKHGVELKVDISAINACDKDTQRAYALTDFSISASVASAQEISIVKAAQQPRFFRRLHRAVENMTPYYRKSVYKEPHFHFDKNFFKAPGTVYLYGFWQSERYFQKIASVLRKEFQIIDPQQGRNAELAEIINSSNSVSVHIRGGDYVNNPVTHKHHGACSPAYYGRCIEWISGHIKNPLFFVFSDDIARAKAQLPAHEYFVFVDHNTEKNAHEDLRLMSQCKHHIIANSTFSWWGAWLGSHHDKKVLAPVPWFSNPGRTTTDLLPGGWITIEAR
ncbi:MAG: alpha-1,2-fucosyltransferase [Deltaproteobacteria bacterium]|nr:alpha-1,2-fucosyltransferase [Deltaproteobacteria bacterium]